MSNRYLRISLLVCYSLCAMEESEHKSLPSPLKTLAIAGALSAFYSEDGQFLIIDAKNAVGRTMAVRKTTDYEGGINIPLPPHCFISTISPDNYAITADNYNPLIKWNITNGAHEAMSELTAGAAFARYDKSGQQLLFSRQGKIFLLDLASNKIVKKIEREAYHATAAWNPADAHQVGVSLQKANYCDSEWCIWDLVADKIRTLATIAPRILGNIMTYNNTGDSLVSGNLGQFVKCDTQTAAIVYYSVDGRKSNQPFQDGNQLNSASVVPGVGTRLFAGANKNRLVYCDMDDISQSFVCNPEPSNTTNDIKALAINSSRKELAINTVNATNESVVKILTIKSHIKL